MGGARIAVTNISLREESRLDHCLPQKILSFGKTRDPRAVPHLKELDKNQLSYRRRKDLSAVPAIAAS